MRSFKDSTGRLWEISVTAAAMARVKGLVGVNLAGLFGDGMKPYAEFLDDPIARANAIYAICKPQCDAKNVTDEQFGEALGGDAMEAATMALQEELIDFFPKSKRDPLRKMMAKIRTAVELTEARGARAVDEINEATLAEQLIASFGNAPASSASTPAHSL